MKPGENNSSIAPSSFISIWNFVTTNHFPPLTSRKVVFKKQN